MWPLLRINFFLAIWLCILWNAYALWDSTHRVEEFRLQYGAYMMRAVLAPLLIAGTQFSLWLLVYRCANRVARVAAGCAGAYFAIIVIVQLLRSSIDIPISAPWTWFYVYLAASHLAYAFLGRRADQADV